MTTNLLNKSAVKEVCKEQNLSVSGDFYEALNTKLRVFIDESSKRATLNGRKTVFPKDL